MVAGKNNKYHDLFRYKSCTNDYISTPSYGKLFVVEKSVGFVTLLQTLWENISLILTSFTFIWVKLLLCLS